MFNQGVNAQYKPQITQDGVAGSMVARGPAAVGISGSCDTAVATVYPCLDANVDAKWGSNQWVDGGFPILEAFGGNNTSGPIDAAAALLAHGGSVGRLDFASETFTVVPEVANPLTHRMHKGINTTVDEGQTPIVTSGSSAQAMRESGQGFWMKDEIAGTLRAEGEDRPSRPSCVIAQPAISVAYGLRGDAGREGVAKTPSADAEGRVRLRNPSFNPMEELSPTMDASQPHAVAFTQNQREEVRILDVAGACSAEPGSHQQTYIAQPAVAYVKATNPHSKEEAPRYEEAAVSACLNGWDERHEPPKHMVAFKESQSGCRTGAVHATIDANKGSRRQEGVLSSMQVRRLTPSECEYLQGFPAGHTDIIFRKKPAADGPRYRALGNSMAVPCMFWLGYRIHHATKGDNT